MRTSVARLCAELDRGGPELAGRRCVETWGVKDLLAVRAWWTERVVDWIQAGRRGDTPSLPEKGYTWNETPRLNADIVRGARTQSYHTVRARLERGVDRVLATIDELDDRELLKVGVFPWAGNWPIARWISVNTVRQYTTARAFIRKALGGR